MQRELCLLKMLKSTLKIANKEKKLNRKAMITILMRLKKMKEEKSSNNDMDSENKEIEANTKEKSSSPSLFSAHKTSKTSKLVRINNDQVKIYESIQGDAFEAGSKHTRITYYVKKEAEV